MRTKLHTIFLVLIRNINTRNNVLKYFAEILRTNEKRIQYNADDRHLARDGFMLNFMSILQHLSSKIKLDRIDVMYLFRPDSFISYKNDTRLRFSSNEYNDYAEKLSNLITLHLIWNI